jgi:hypothetical protein
VSFDRSPPPSAGYHQLDAAARQFEHASPDRPAPTPASFPVVAVVARADGSGPSRWVRGELRISPGAIVFSPFATAHPGEGAGDLIHRARTIAMTTAWLSPPWANTFLLLQDGTSHARVAAPLRSRRRLARELARSGLTLQTAGSWRPPELGSG